MRPLTPLLLALSLTLPGIATAQNILQRYPASHAFIEMMIKEHGFERESLHQLFAQIEDKPRIIEVMERPAEGKPWYEYRNIFLTDKRIREGIRFWAEHAALLQQAEQRYGVPPHIIVAIIGVETFYGRHKGSYRVADALSTLGFGYPKRGEFFRKQLEEFLIMSREEQREPLQFLGSYAGAMGMPQFIPSSFRHFAVDFDGDGQRDLWDNPADIIGSVANYFHRHNWQPGAAVVSRAKLGTKRVEPFLDKGLKPSTPYEQLQQAGVTTEAPLQAHALTTLLALDKSASSKEYWVALQNFYVITRYNHSPLYAMAVHQLSEAIREGRLAEQNHAQHSDH